ncbi:hypothetical protein ABZP26_06520 [Pseudoalteromonas sp. SD03]|uniref:Uncharacterized protein n=1 Tax=Pseudoalteromonas sp. SD03 TaxID=3231719 RepID=A0AB39ATX0_9GAMM|nr:hypothetical protein [Pseudoalteromonas undina]
MTENHTNTDERRVHRITTYFSKTELAEFLKAFKKSTITNSSQFIRHQLMLSIDPDAKIVISIPKINKDIAIEMTNCVSALNRLVSFLEQEVLTDETRSDESKVDNLNKAIKYVNEVDKAAWMLAHFFKGDIHKKHVMQNMALITLSSNELLELAAVSIAEGDFVQ